MSFIFKYKFFILIILDNYIMDSQWVANKTTNHLLYWCTTFNIDIKTLKSSTVMPHIYVHHQECKWTAGLQCQKLVIWEGGGGDNHWTQRLGKRLDFACAIFWDMIIIQVLQKTLSPSICVHRNELLSSKLNVSQKIYPKS